MKKILIYTQWFDPEPTFKGIVFAQELKKKGFDVEVLTGVPNYPTGNIYSGYRNHFFQTELMDGIKINRVYLFPNHDRSAIKRVFNYISFAFSSFLFLLFTRKKFDLIYTYHPPLTTGVVSSFIRIIKKIPVVYDIQDMWPDTLRVTGMLNNERILNCVGLVAKYVYKNLDQLVVLSPGFKKLLIERGVREDKIKIIPNWCDEKSLNYIEESLVLPGTNSFKLLFAGNIGKAQSLDIILDVAKMMENKVDFVFLGDGVEKENLLMKKKNENILNAHFLPSVPMSRVASYMKASDALLVFLKKDPLFEITIPSKTQAYMYFGKPIVMGVGGDASDLVMDANGGILISQFDVGLIVEKITELVSLSSDDLEIMGMNSKRYYEKHLSLDSGCSKFAEIFNKL